MQLLRRWGVACRDLMARETLAPPWREVLLVLRKKEAQGEVRGGRFVASISGEQFALPDALDVLRHVRRSESRGEEVRVSASDPLNLARNAGLVLYRDGVALEESAESYRLPAC